MQGASSITSRPERAATVGRTSARNAGLLNRSGETRSRSTSSRKIASRILPVVRFSLLIVRGSDAGALGHPDLVAHQREERRDEDRRPGAGIAEQPRGDEVDGRLPSRSAGRGLGGARRRRPRSPRAGPDGSQRPRQRSRAGARRGGRSRREPTDAERHSWVATLHGDATKQRLPIGSQATSFHSVRFSLPRPRWHRDADGSWKPWSPSERTGTAFRPGS